MPNTHVVRHHILIVGAGEFGIATALALLQRPSYTNSHITIVDSSSTLPNPAGSSVDTNRIIRADYAAKPYCKLATQAQHHWRDQSEAGWGGQGRYHESGFVLTADTHKDYYVKEALANVRALGDEGFEGMDQKKIEELKNREEIKKATGYEGVMGDLGYANWNSGWADAEAVVAFALEKVERIGGERVSLMSGRKVRRLMFNHDSKCVGAELDDGHFKHADLTILAAGAWTPSLIDLRGRCLATGQTLAYLDISEEELTWLKKTPVVMNMSRAMFIIPPRGRELKVARHGYGYLNPKHLSNSTNDVLDQPSDEAREVSVPKVGLKIPAEAEKACREALRELIPSMGDRPFTRTRICWYCDTCVKPIPYLKCR